MVDPSSRKELSLVPYVLHVPLSIATKITEEVKANCAVQFESDLSLVSLSISVASTPSVTAGCSVGTPSQKKWISSPEWRERGVTNTAVRVRASLAAASGISPFRQPRSRRARVTRAFLSVAEELAHHFQTFLSLAISRPSCCDSAANCRGSLNLAWIAFLRE